MTALSELGREKRESSSEHNGNQREGAEGLSGVLYPDVLARREDVIVRDDGAGGELLSC